MRLQGKTPITLQLDDETLDDVRIVARRRGQTMSEFIRRAIDLELSLEAEQSIPD